MSYYDDDPAVEKVIKAAVEERRQREQRRTFWLRIVAMALLTLLLVWVFPVQARDRTPANGLCEWRNPGGSKYMLPLDRAIDRLTSIPADVRQRLKARVLDPRKHVNADDHVLITREVIVGEDAYWALYDMNGGQGEVCWGEVTRTTWSPEHAERALVFCESGYCVAYASVCRNIARALVITPRRDREDKPRAIDTVPKIDLDLPVAKLDAPSFKMLQVDVPGGSSSDEIETTGRTTWDDEPFDWGRQRMGMPLTPLTSSQAPPVVIGLPPPVVTPVPEPSTFALLALGVFLILLARRLNQ